MSGVLNDCDALLQAAPVRIIPNGLAAQVQEALDAAAAAQEDADAANLLLADIASDGKLTPSEKPELVAKRDAIIAEQTGMEAEATGMGVTTEKAAYTAAIKALTDYLASAPLAGWSTIPGGTITVAGADLRAKFNDVYAKRQALRNAITIAAASKAVWANISGAGKPEDGATVGAPAGTLVNGVPVANITSAITNFNSSNDRNSAALAIPTIVTDGSAIDHTIRKDGSADISLEWVWAGAEGDIDGFLVYVYQSTSSFAYTFGSTPALETVYTVPANKRSFILFGSAADLYTTFGVQAYRSVDKDINSAGAIKSPLVKPGLAAENPYRPQANVAFGGDITGTVNGTAVATLLANAAAGKAASDAIAAITADGILDRSEKAAVRKEWGMLYDSERPTLVAQAAALGVSSTAYTDALSLLAQYLEGIGAGSEWANTAVDSTIDRITFNAKFAGVYAAKQALLNAFVSAASRDFASYITWDFRGTLDGWQNISGISSMSYTSDSMIIQSAGGDPIFRSPYGLNIAGSLYNVVRMKVKRLAGSSFDGILCWATPQYSEANGGQITGSTDTTKMNEWVILEWDLSKVAAWTERTIQYIRPDLGASAADKFEIDWISIGRYGPAVSASELAAAKAAADAANAAIAAFANDYVLDRGEKAQLVREWVQEDAIWSQLRAQADALGVSHTNYDNNHKDTSDYLLSLNPSWSDTTQDTAIDREYFKLRFTWLYEARVALQNAIAAKAATTADANKITGMTHFRVLTQGNSRSTNTKPSGSDGLYRNGVHTVGAGRSYTLVAISRSTGLITFNRTFDVYGDPAQANELRNYLNLFSSDVVIVVYTYDEPCNNRTTNSLDIAMYRCGASRAVFGSPEFKIHAAYCLIGIPGCGEGNGAEFYQGAIDHDPNAWIDVAFSLVNGNFTASGGYIPRSLRDYSYTGDYNATSGAPAGTQVAGVDAAVVASGAQAGASLKTPFAVSIGGTVSANIGGKTGTVATRTASITGSANVKSVQWALLDPTGDGSLYLQNASTQTVTVRSNVGAVPSDSGAVLVCTVSGLDGRVATDSVSASVHHA